MERIETSQNFIKMEHDVLEFWDKNCCFDKLREKNKNGKAFRFIDGPITANNPMGIHHAWGRTLKDIFIRYKALNGFDCHYINGFDAQGLWVEVEVEKELGFNSKKDIEDYGMDNFTKKCVERVKKFSKRITEQSVRLGQWMDWENSYFTHTDENISGIWQFLKKCHSNGWITLNYKPMPWCPRCGTSLSEHEMTGSYKDIEHKSVFLKLPLVGKNLKALVWTTTPWTLTSNVALAVNPQIDYCEVKVKSDEQHLVLAKDAIGVLGDDKLEVVRVFKGEELLGYEYETCFNNFDLQKDIEHKVVPWEDVDSKEGTGIVHIAPGCGVEDFELGQSLNLPQIMPVDDDGVFMSGFGWLTGKNIKDTTDEIIEKLDEVGKLFNSHMYLHSYPVCWRCKSEVIYRLVRAWYIKTQEVKPRLINAAKKVKWEPEYIGKRMQDWLERMGDWNISRKRFYGLPLPFYYCEKCNELTVIGSKEDLKAYGAKGVDNLPELHRPWIDEISIVCPKCSAKVERVPETGDVWLDAGIVPFSTLGYFNDRESWSKYFPIEWVCEMREQVRLWFYSMLFMGVTLEDKAPYERVLAYNTVVAEDGSKFSKTGNMIRFDEAAEAIGVDPIRYLYAGANVSSDVRFGFSLGDEARRKLLGFWNIYVFFNTYAKIDLPDIKGFEPRGEDLNVTDRWLLTRTNEMIKKAKDYMDNYQAYNLVKEFDLFVEEVSNWYIRTNRRRFWKSDFESDKKVAYYCLYNAIKSLVQIMAPIIPFMTEHIWQEMVRKIEPDAEISVHLSNFPDVINNSIISDENIIIEDTNTVRKIIALALRLRNEKQVKVRQPISKLYLKIDEKNKLAVDKMSEIIKDELNIKDVDYIDSEEVLDEGTLMVNFKRAGAVLKKDVQKLKKVLESLDDAQMKLLTTQVEQGNEIQIDGFEMKLTSDLFEIQRVPKKGIVIGKEDSIILALDLNLTEDLIIEGAMRDIVRQCQVLRKEADLKVEQRIIIGLKSENDFIDKTIDTYKEHIKEEVLADKIVADIKNPIIEREIEVNDFKLKIYIGEI